MKHLFIINPAAGSRNQTEFYRQKIQQAQIPCQIAVSTAPGHCRQIAAQAAQTGEELRIYACGGDGTLNEIVNGVAGFPNAAVTHYTGGSGNDFVKIFSDTAPFRDLNQLLDCQETSFDLIQCNGDYALNICSVGLDARVGTDVANYKRLPLLNGFRAYAVSALINTLKGVSQHYVVELGAQTIDAEQTFVCVCNGRFYGGGFNPVPEADPQDGLLDILLVKKVSRLKIAAVIGKYKNGRYAELSDLARHVRAKEITIHCDRPNAVNLDGEKRMATDVNIRIANQRIRFFYPKTVSLKPALASV